MTIENNHSSLTKTFESLLCLNSEVMLNNFFSLTSEAIVILDENFDFVFANDTAKSIYLVENSDFLGTNYLDFCETRNIQPFAPKAMFLNKNFNHYQNFKNSIVKDDHVKIIVWNVSKCVLADRTYFFAVGHDDTEFNLLQKKEKNTREYLQNIIQHIPGYIFWKDTNSILQGCNESFAKLTGETTTSIIGKTDYELPWNIEEAENFIQDDKDVMQSGIPKLNIVEPMRKSDGSQRVLLTHKVPLRDPDDNVIGVIGICSDITEKIQAEEELKTAKEKAEAANKAKNEFLQNMSHDIRTPFVGILGMSRLLYQAENDQKKQKEIGYIVESSEKLLNLLTEIIELVKVDFGAHPIVYDKFDLKEVIDNVVGIMRAQAYQKNLKMIVNCHDELPQIFSDRLRIHRILLNLLSNAVKFTHKGSVEISAEIIKKTKEITLVKLIVADTGIGIPQNKFDYIFENFNKLSSSYEGIFQGAGIGLNIVKQFINDIKGKISIESKLGEGTKFICVIPYKVKH